MWVAVENKNGQHHLMPLIDDIDHVATLECTCGVSLDEYGVFVHYTAQQNNDADYDLAEAISKLDF